MNRSRGARKEERDAREEGREAGPDQERSGLERGMSEETVTLLSSSGVAEFLGHCLGQFVFIGYYNCAVAFKQRHSTSDKSLFLYKHKSDVWVVASELGGDDYDLQSTSFSVLSDKWQYKMYPDWRHDPTLKIKREVTPCQTITVELRGAAARTQSDVSGEYSPIGDWSWGRQVFKHRERNLYLRVKLDGWGGWGAWCIGDKPDDHLGGDHVGGDHVGGDHVGGDHVGSQVTTWCPADPRAAISQTYNYKSWIYIINGMEQGDIRVKCKIHS